jgi:hypothetical protein
LKILITGDSFAADWSVKYDVAGWPNLLAQEHDVTNLAQAGCGEYKILKQLQQANLKDYDAVIVSHTSPYRLHVSEHPVHKNDLLHYNSDFIYADIVEHGLKDVEEFYKKYFDLDHARDMHRLICKEIDGVTAPYPTIHITHSNWQGLYAFARMINFSKANKKHPGDANHYSTVGNKLVFEEIKSRLANM